MNDPRMTVTELLQAWPEDEMAMHRVLPYVYDELSRMAHGLRQKERRDLTLDTSALVHDAYIKLVDTKRASWQNRTHFFGAAARAMRQILVEHARKRNRLKRGSGVKPLPLDDLVTLPAVLPNHDLLALDEALTHLETLDKRQCHIVECRYFAGMTIEETAAALDISTATVKRDWTTARAWLYHQLKSG